MLMSIVGDKPNGNYSFSLEEIKKTLKKCFTNKIERRKVLTEFKKPINNSKRISNQNKKKTIFQLGSNLHKIHLYIFISTFPSKKRLFNKK